MFLLNTSCVELACDTLLLDINDASSYSIDIPSNAKKFEYSNGLSIIRAGKKNRTHVFLHNLLQRNSGNNHNNNNNNNNGNDNSKTAQQQKMLDAIAMITQKYLGLSI